LTPFLLQFEDSEKDGTDDVLMLSRHVLVVWTRLKRPYITVTTLRPTTTAFASSRPFMGLQLSMHSEAHLPTENDY